jgi:hypothetical protein
VLAAGVCVVVAAIVAVLTRPTTSPRADQIDAFQAAIHAPVQHWGKVQVLGMRPAMGDLRRGTGVPAATIAQEAQAWQSGLALVGRQLDAVSVPPYLSHAMALFKQALAQYTDVAVLVQQAAATDGPARISLLDQAVASGLRGDCIYDDASVEIQQARRDAGLGTTRDFPDHPCAGRS